MLDYEYWVEVADESFSQADDVTSLYAKFTGQVMGLLPANLNDQTKVQIFKAMAELIRKHEQRIVNKEGHVV